MSNSPITPPPFALLPLEAPRAAFEATTVPWAALSTRMAPQGDGHPVMTLPGFLASDQSMLPVRHFLRRKGYTTHRWKLGQNRGPLAIGIEGEHLQKRIEELYARTERQISLVGWSLGGVMAREAAKRLPHMVRQVITMGSPFSGGPGSSNIARLYRALAKHDVPHEEMEELTRKLRVPPPVPSTAIFSRTDGVVSWRGCLEAPSDTTDNIEVVSSHCGLGFSPLVLYLLAERLAVPKSDWSPFDRKMFNWRRVAFPTSGHVYGVNALTEEEMNMPPSPWGANDYGPEWIAA